MSKKADRKYYWKNREKLLGKRHDYYHRIKLEVFQHYSGGMPRCAHCGESDIVVLCVDHIEGGGNQRRREAKETGKGEFLYAWLIRNEYPLGYQILCYNCNQRKKIKNKESGKRFLNLKECSQ